MKRPGDVTYGIDTWRYGFSYSNTDDIIYFGLIEKQWKHLTDDELIDYIADCLMHEHIHRVLNRELNDIISKLFDAIEHYVCDNELAAKALKYYTPDDKETWQSYIKRRGFDAFLRRYSLTNDDLKAVGVYRKV